jgi:hypothetical protein
LKSKGKSREAQLFPEEKNRIRPEANRIEASDPIRELLKNRLPAN